MDLLQTGEVSLIQHIQTSFNGVQGYLNFMSAVGDIRTAFLVYFPICFFIDRRVGTKIVWSLVIGDWINLMFKWVLFGHRPYWWVHETHMYSNDSIPELKQFPITCETGAGSPSGHAMGSSCVWYVMVSAFLASHMLPKQSYRYAKFPLWTMFCIIQVSVCISRLFVAAHFPHQVILGAVAGVLVAEYFEHLHFIHTAALQRYVGAALLLFLSAFGFYLFLRILGVDLLWTVDIARKWCARPEWVHLDSSPFAGLMRNLGILVGLGLALRFPSSQDSLCSQYSSLFFRLVCISASIVIIHFFDSLPLPSQSELLFYTAIFLKSTAIPLIAVALIPYFVQNLIGDTDKKHV
uniref:glucose-6-phosphatase 2-like n=1 Tax=Myxine glutinosa TaxID=7769 RepID=UPI00358F0F90